MSTDTDLLHVARPSRCNTQQTATTMQQRPQQPRNKPPSLKALAEGVLAKGGRNSECNSGATALLHTPSAQQGAPQQMQQSPEAERRRQIVLKMLADNPTTERAVYCDDDTTDPVILTVAVRGKGTLEVLIPQVKYDGFAIIELATTGKRAELAVIEGGKSGDQANHREAA